MGLRLNAAQHIKSEFSIASQDWQPFSLGQWYPQGTYSHMQGLLGRRALGTITSLISVGEEEEERFTAPGESHQPSATRPRHADTPLRTLARENLLKRDRNSIH